MRTAICTMMNRFLDRKIKFDGSKTPNKSLYIPKYFWATNLARRRLCPTQKEDNGKTIGIKERH